MGKHAKSYCFLATYYDIIRESQIWAQTKVSDEDQTVHQLATSHNNSIEAIIFWSSTKRIRGAFKYFVRHA